MAPLMDITAQYVAARSDSSLRNILVHVEPGPEASGRLQTAVDLAWKFDATLTGLGAEMVQTLNDPNGLLGGAWIAPLQDLVEDDLRRAEEVFRAKSTGLKTEWKSLETFPVNALARLARSADLIVAGGAPRNLENAYRAAAPSELVMLSGRPVLVAPPRPAKFHGQAVVVAWQDTRESRRALSDSLPFLKVAEEVLVVECCAKNQVDAAASNTADVVHHLRRHGVKAHGKAIVSAPERVAAELQSAAQTLGADLIVAGAYGHSRLGEWAFGGVTFELLNAPERFVLLSH